MNDSDTFGDSNLLSDESSPLLSQAENRHNVESQRPQLRDTPVPKLQLAMICLVRALDPIGFTQLLPYINEMLVNLGVVSDPSKVGFFSGLVESTFAITQMLAIYPWARFSDKVGRKPAVLCSLAGMSLMTLLFGVSSNLPILLITRALHGLFAGSVAVTQSILGEITDPSNQHLAVPVFAMMWPMGSILGPLLGGTLSNPATKYPKLFKDTIFSEYPYLLPCLGVSAISGFGAALVYYFMDETSPRLSKDVCKSYNAVECRNPTPEPISIKSLLSIQIIRALALSGFALSFICTAFETVFVLFCYTPIDVGGLGFDNPEIGFALCVGGVTSIAFQVFLMPIMLRKGNHKRLYHTCMSFWPAPFAFLPFLNAVARNGIDESGNMTPKTQTAVWLGIVVAIMVERICCLAYSLSMVLVKENISHPSHLGPVNGLVNVGLSFGRIFGPAFANSLFAATAELDVLGGNIWVLVLISAAFCGTLCSAKVAAEISH